MPEAVEAVAGGPPALLVAAARPGTYEIRYYSKLSSGVPVTRALVVR